MVKFLLFKMNRNRKTESKTVKELRDELGELGAKKTGNKETLQKRYISSFFSNNKTVS